MRSNVVSSLAREVDCQGEDDPRVLWLFQWPQRAIAALWGESLVNTFYEGVSTREIFAGALTGSRIASGDDA